MRDRVCRVKYLSADDARASLQFASARAVHAEDNAKARAPFREPIVSERRSVKTCGPHPHCSEPIAGRRGYLLLKSLRRVAAPVARSLTTRISHAYRNRRGLALLAPLRLEDHNSTG
jgi:hypothetical protein